MSSRRTLRRWLRRIFVVAGVLLAVVVSVAGYALAEVVERQDLVTEGYYDALHEAENLNLALVDTEVAVRSFERTGNTVSLETLENGVLAGGAPDPESGAIAALAEDEPAIEAAWARAAAAVDVWFVGYVEPAVASEQAGMPVDTVSDGLYRDARTATDELIEVLESERAANLAVLDRWTATLFGAVVLLALCAILVSAWLWSMVERRVTRPVADLAAQVRHAATDSPETPIQMEGSGEVVGLARDVELMRRTLVSRTAEVEVSHAEVAASHTLLEQQAAALERSNRDLEQFAYVASHDLQEPLRKVASFTQLLKKRYGGQLDERADQYIDFAVDGAKRMQRLIQDLLGFSRVGRTPAPRTDVDLAHLLDQVTSEMSERIEESGATVSADALPTVRGQEVLLRQLLVNVVGNAIKFRDPDRAPEITLAAQDLGSAWEITCTDNGIGIDPQYADRVFVIFQRLHAKEVYEGTGIGLAMCKRIVEFHGGDISVEPAGTGGTTVRWTLAHEPEPEPVPHTADVDDDGRAATVG
ncbi:HAMP domain-containing protein [Paraoerskovia marina]|uniref:histidine kinase n=1 Tax=Paraoerskovia marina TaxID=545619 RepID=A0A1H1TTF6_9CELL|nr:ATP-binding protein [Paraoerskovia marina]SDS63206.1 HAMP domain-containing protein [Paraoerskovia marina]